MSLSKTKAGSEIPSEEVRRYNECLLNRCLQVGDLIEFPRRIYSHWGVYVGGGQVIHFTCLEGDIVKCCNPVTGAKRGEVKKESFWTVVGNSKAEINNCYDETKKKYSPEEIVQRAERCVGNAQYTCGACEKFATWCRYGEGSNKQVVYFCTGAMVVLIAILWYLLRTK